MEKAFELNSELARALPSPREAVDGFNYIADSSFSGLPFPCAGYSCRLKKISQLIGFSSMYANQVIAYNPFSYTSKFENGNRKRFFEELSFSIAAAIAMQPLIDRKILTFVNFRPVTICKECFSKLINSQQQRSVDSRESVFSFAYKTLLDTKKVELLEFDDANKRHVYRMTDTCAIAHEHPSYLITSKSPRNLNALRLPYTLNRNEVIEIGAFHGDALSTANDFLTKSENSYSYRVNMIQSSSNELAVLQRVFGADHAMSKFDASVPFIATRNAYRVLALRDQEWHHFEEFRTLIFDTVSRNEIEGRDLDDFYRGEILPEMVKIEKIVRNYQKKNRDALIDNSAISALSLFSVAITGGLTSLIGLASALLGGGHFAKSMVPSLRKALSEPDAARDSACYYAWKVKNL
jgi:hypothetical protein